MPMYIINDHLKLILTSKRVTIILKLLTTAYLKLLIPAIFSKMSDKIQEFMFSHLTDLSIHIMFILIRFITTTIHTYETFFPHVSLS